jgi:DAK2 domain fusion protein YloV
MADSSASEHDSAQTLEGPALFSAFEAGALALAVQRDALNAINVFPVPDGDTGTNMSLTMRAAADAAAQDQSSCAAVAKAAAQGALMGARGNSGVILSQILSGFDTGDPSASFDGKWIAEALERGRAAAYRVVSNPREGTILTAIMAAAEAAQSSATGGGDAAGVVAAAAQAAQAATDRTPELLPVLKEAGVVDAGAQGLSVLLDGMARALRGESVAAAQGLGSIDASWLGATRRVHGDGGRSGYCTEYIVSGSDLDSDEVRGRLAEMGDSLLVVGGGDFLRVHVHTHSPDQALAYGRSLGAVSQEKVEDMEAQFQELASAGDAAPVASAIAVVAVGAGEGIEALFTSLGAASVIRGGQTMNPSAGDIHDAIKAAGGDMTIVLPNNKNIALAAEQAARSMGGRVVVVPTRSIPQGVAALIAFNPEATVGENTTEMLESLKTVRTGEVTLAARPTTIGGLEVREGQPIGLIDGELAVARESVEEAARECVRLMSEGREGPLVTLYTGEDTTAASAEALAASLREEFGCEVEVVAGGQPHYPYLIGVE